MNATIRRLKCNICGEATTGRQWHNRDLGYGTCGKCISWLRNKGTSEAEILDYYGQENIHWFINEGGAK